MSGNWIIALDEKAASTNALQSLNASAAVQPFESKSDYIVMRRSQKGRVVQVKVSFINADKRTKTIIIRAQRSDAMVRNRDANSSLRRSQRRLRRLLLTRNR
ncbi:hypothetical protein C5750_25990 [Phyllobacterium myrsinacearum]|jgi:hypothetical protein|uniref:Uncharacterized protein n=1 Tax=Phyllobacterium myrsinacearum TaxID=28101 RepID=A0A2S9J9S0_9HYPH|nr:hypothetical protein C5750_25990 [Phyllobacterium myrsinacearum]